MTEPEYKFLEVFYDRGTVQEQSFVNYLNGSLPESIENKKEYIDSLFSKFQEFGFIDAPTAGTYQITDLGKEKFEELSERKEIHKKLDTLTSKRSKFIHFDAKFWLALIILMVLVSMATSVVLNRWQNISDLLRKLVR